MRLSLSDDDDGERIELGEETKAAHLLVKAIKRKQLISSHINFYEEIQ